MDFNKLFRRTKKAVEDRGGTGALKEDAQELSDIARGRGSTGEKIKEAADALKDPGAPGQDRPPRQDPPQRRT
jgi:hypothetical protein